MRVRFAALSLTLAVCCSTMFPWGGGAQAQSDPSAIVSGLPELLDENSSGQVINAASIISYKPIVPAELLSLFKDGQLEIEAARNIKSAPKLNDSWGRGREGTAALAGISGELRPGATFGKGWLFDPAGFATENNQRSLAYKVLWNSIAVWATQPLFLAHFEFSWFKEGKPYRSLQGEFSRAVPNVLPNVKPTAQIFRELIRFTAPQFLRDLSWLTFRFLGADEDVLWVYSPAIKKLRQLTSTNRSDPILRSALTPEEFLVWSGKPEAVDAIVDGAAILLVPVLRTELPARSNKDGCSTVDRAGAVGGKLGVRWNYETTRFPHGAGWVPGTSIFLPRAVWRIAVNSLDPFSSYGRQTVYVDQALGLPVYKFVYNRMGQLWKTVLGVHGVAAISSGTGQLPYPAYTIVIDHLKSEVYVVDYASITSCTQPQPSLSLAEFDPKRFSVSEADSGGKVAGPVPSPTPEPELDEL